MAYASVSSLCLDVNAITASVHVPCRHMRQCMQPYPIRSSRVTGNRSSSLYAGMTTERDFVASAKIEGGGTCKICGAVDHKCMCIALTGKVRDCYNAKVVQLVSTFSNELGSSKKCWEASKWLSASTLLNHCAARQMINVTAVA